MAVAAKKFLIGLGDLADLKHVPGPPEPTLGNGFQSACRCGYPGASRSTPTHAYNSTSVHAENANRADSTPANTTPGGVERGAIPSRRPEGSPATVRSSGVPREQRAPRGAQKPCGCGCGEQCGGRYRPGHDARFVSQLTAKVKSGDLTAADALAKLDDQPKLRAKLGGRL
jgi:hypothetical protein